MNTIEIILASTILITLVWVRQEVISIKARKYKKSKKTDAKRARALQQIVWNRETAIRMQNSQIQGLNGDIAKLKYDYACEVAGWNGRATKEPINARAGHCECCSGTGKFRKPYARLVSDCESCNSTGLETVKTDENKTE